MTYRSVGRRWRRRLRSGRSLWRRWRNGWCQIRSFGGRSDPRCEWPQPDASWGSYRYHARRSGAKLNIAVIRWRVVARRGRESAFRTCVSRVRRADLPTLSTVCGAVERQYSGDVRIAGGTLYLLKVGLGHCAQRIGGGEGEMRHADEWEDEMLG